jgi:hypothetical protein
MMSLRFGSAIPGTQKFDCMLTKLASKWKNKQNMIQQKGSPLKVSISCVIMSEQLQHCTTITG